MAANGFGIDFGQNQYNDTARDADQAKQAIGQRAAELSQSVGQLGQSVENAGNELHQGILHNQVLSATLASRQAQEQTIKEIQSTPITTVGDLKKALSPEGFQKALTSARVLNPNLKETDSELQVPMYSVAGDYFDDRMKSANEAAGSAIALPGWRNQWMKSAADEQQVTRGMRVNRVAAEQMVHAQTAETEQKIVQAMNSAQTVQQLDIAYAGLKSSTMDPAKVPQYKAMIDQHADKLPYQQAMQGPGTDYNKAKVQEGIDHLSNPDEAAANFGHLSMDEREQFKSRLQYQLKSWGMADQEGQLADEKWKKSQDEESFGKYVEALDPSNMARNDPSTFQNIGKHREFVNRNENRDSPLSSGFFSGEMAEKAIHLRQTMIDNQKNDVQKDNPQSTLAADQFYSENPKAFHDALASGHPFKHVLDTSDGPVEVTIDPTKDFTTGTFNKYRADLAKWNSPEKAEAARAHAAEASLGDEIKGILNDPDTGFKGRLDGKDPDVLQKRLEITNRMKDQIKQQQTDTSGHVTPMDAVKRKQVLTEIAKSAADSMDRTTSVESNTAPGLNIDIGAGNKSQIIRVPNSAITDFTAAAKEAGKPWFAGSGPAGLEFNLKEYYGKAEPAITNTLKAFGADESDQKMAMRVFMTMQKGFADHSIKVPATFAGDFYNYASRIAYLRMTSNSKALRGDTSSSVSPELAARQQKQAQIDEAVGADLKPIDPNLSPEERDKEIQRRIDLSNGATK